MTEILTDLFEEAIPLLAEDLRTARVGLGITPAVAAERAELGPVLYRALEQGSFARNLDNVNLMLTAARRLGMKDARVTYIDEVQQYMKVDLSKEGPLTIFVDTLRLNARDLREQSVFISPSLELAFIERLGFDKTLASRKPVDKQLIELWISAVFTLCLNGDLDYYVRLVKDDPPDTEVLRINGTGENMGVIRVEITQHGSHSKGLADVVGKKLRHKYPEGTVLVVLAEHAEKILVTELDKLIRKNNPHKQRIYIIGGAKEPGSFKVVPWDEVTKHTPCETAWLEIYVEAPGASKGYRGYQGVVYNPPGSSFLPGRPVFVKELELHR